MEKKERILDEDGCVIRVNKEEEKRNRDEIKDFVKTLLKLGHDKYDDLPIDDRLRLALIEGKRLTGNAYKRHLSFLSRLVFVQDYEKIRSSHEHVHHAIRNDPGKIRETESYRDRLIAGDKDVINELMEKFADVEVQYLRQMSRHANKEIVLELKRLKEKAEISGHVFDETKPIKLTKSSRLLYQHLFKLELL